MWKKSLKWGVLLGVAISFLELVRMYARLYQYEARSIFDIVLIIIFIALLYLAQKDYKETLGGGYLSFAKAFGIGVIVTVTALLIYLCYMMFHFSLIEPTAVQRIYEGKVTNVLAAAMLYSLPVLLYGLFFDLFTAMYLYKKKEDENKLKTEN
jgi:hypothetical protein